MNQEDDEEAPININSRGQEIQIPEEDLQVVAEQLADLHRDPMHRIKFIALGIFSFGGLLMAISLLVPTCAHCCRGPVAASFRSDFDTTPSEPPIRIYPAEDDGGKSESTGEEVFLEGLP